MLWQGSDKDVAPCSAPPGAEVSLQVPTALAFAGLTTGRLQAQLYLQDTAKEKIHSSY